MSESVIYHLGAKTSKRLKRQIQSPQKGEKPTAPTVSFSVIQAPNQETQIMTNVSTRPHPSAILPTAPAGPAATRSAATPTPPAIEFDSSGFDMLVARTAEIAALASCVTCLTATETTDDSHAGYELTADALPLLGHVIQRLAREAAEASDQLWEQYEQARGVANGSGCAA